MPAGGVFQNVVRSNGRLVEHSRRPYANASGIAIGDFRAFSTLRYNLAENIGFVDQPKSLGRRFCAVAKKPAANDVAAGLTIA